MSTPPLLLGCALLFWGWQTGLLVLAVPTALLVEASRRVRWRLEFEQDHFNRLWNLSFLLALGLSFYLFFAQGGYSAVNDLVGTGPGSGGTRENSLRNVSNLLLRLVQCLPATMLLFLLAYAFGPVRTLPVSTFSLIYRRRAARPRQPGNQRFQDRRIDPAHGFLVLLLLAVSASNINPTWFFPALAALLAWTLWGLKSASVRPRWWITAMGVAIVLGFSSQLAVLHLQQLFEAWQNRLMQRLGNAREFDTTQTETSMGRLGELKQSGSIIWRVRSPATNPPGLLMEAAFNVYQQPSSTNTSGGFDPPSWTTRLRRFENSVDARRDADFQLNTNAFPVRSVTLTGYTRNGEVHIPYPDGTSIITDKTAEVLVIQTNTLGAARAIGGPALAIFEMWYGPNGGFAIGPYEDDVETGLLAPADELALQIIADELKLGTASPAEAVARIRLFYFNHFSYTLDLTAPPTSATNNTPLSDFLLERRTGHCEFFATATTLLLRKAGVPARYAVGYSVQEKRAEHQFVVRERHAHAWTLAWLGNRWVEVDFTPAGWFEAEWSRASLWESQLDWWSDAWLAFQLWRQGDGEFRLYVLIAGVLALSYLAWRQVAGRSWRKARSGDEAGKGFQPAGLDSEFFEIERALIKSRPREAAESMRAWLRRQNFPEAELGRRLQDLLVLHYRLRFDPAGLSSDERTRLRHDARAWLKRFKGVGSQY